MKVVLKRGTTSFIVRVGTRTSGDSNLQLQLLSPTGRLELAHAHSPFVHGDLGRRDRTHRWCGAFLLFWWFRSASRRRRRHAARRGRNPHHELASGAVPDPAS